MKQFVYIIKDESGIHARPAGLLVKTAQKFESEITLQFGEKTASAKKLFALMGLGIKKDDEIIIKAEGSDEDEAVNALQDFLQITL